MSLHLDCAGDKHRDGAFFAGDIKSIPGFYVSGLLFFAQNTVIESPPVRRGRLLSRHMQCVVFSIPDTVTTSKVFCIHDDYIHIGMLIKTSMTLLNRVIFSSYQILNKASLPQTTGSREF